VARRVPDFEFGVRRGKPKYPWSEWTDGQPWEVVHGKDFTCTPGSLVVYLYHKANELGMNVRTSIVRGTGKQRDRVVFQFWKQDAEQTPVEPVTQQRRSLKRKGGTRGRRKDSDQ
jgi:hypothetical protein